MAATVGPRIVTNLMELLHRIKNNELTSEEVDLSFAEIRDRIKLHNEAIVGNISPERKRKYDQLTQEQFDSFEKKMREEHEFLKRKEEDRIARENTPEYKDLKLKYTVGIVSLVAIGVIAIVALVCLFHFYIPYLGK